MLAIHCKYIKYESTVTVLKCYINKLKTNIWVCYDDIEIAKRKYIIICNTIKQKSGIHMNMQKLTYGYVRAILLGLVVRLKLVLAASGCVPVGSF